ncbi:hypothetical protein [uncultured Dialister sp.]|jgi:hypothetical protein|uniref:hypothetical protein n=1 Tax=Dialister sp. TaxID=1955814 RepID=UPI0025DB92AC|nr:hypothetical protein [uncultured Dialister sp.]
MEKKFDKEGAVIDEEIKEGVKELKKDSPAAAYKAEKILETEDEVFKNKPSDVPSDSDR